MTDRTEADDCPEDLIPTRKSLLGVVGSVCPTGTTSSDCEAFLWHGGAPLHTLISLKSVSDTSGVSALSWAAGINNAAQILAVGYPNGPVSVLMNPE